MKNEELIEKLAVIMDRLDRIERKVDDLKKNQNENILPYVPQTYPSTSPQIWYRDKNITDFDKITCTNEDYTVEWQI